MPSRPILSGVSPTEKKLVHLKTAEHAGTPVRSPCAQLNMSRAMLWMHKIGFSGRLFLRGVRMTRTGNGVGLVQIKMKKLE